MEKKKTSVALKVGGYTIPAPSEQKAGTWSETATRVLRERYLLRDATGAIVETPDEMCWRVASAVAMAETQWTKDRAAVAKTAQRFYDMMVEHRFLPNSPTLMNAGKGNNLQLSACFPAGTMIATREGPVPIEDIQAGDTVLTDRGRYRPVVETMTRRDLVYRIKVDKLPTFEVTGEHPFFTQRGWVKAAELEPCADFVFIGTYTQRHDADMGLPRISVRGVRVGEHIYHPISVNSSRYGRGEEVSQQIRAVTADVEVDEEIAWLLGYYIAEGSISAGYDLRFTANVSERALLERALDILQRRLNLTGSIHATARTTTHGEWLDARVHSKLFTEWLDIHFSHGFARKKLPAWLFDAPTSVISSFLEGVSDGDGTRMNATQIRITLSNEALVRQLFELLRIMGHAPCLSREYLPAHATTQAWSVTYGLHVNRGMVHDRADGAVAYRVRSVEQVDDTPVDVYNLEVAEDHTYVANQIVVHNCYVVPVEDSLEGIFEAVKHAALIHQSGGGTGFSFSRLRPKGSIVGSTHGVASGPVSFMKIFDGATEAVKQGGTRRGANMGVLRVDHPDIEEFIDCKRDGSVTNFNISVGVTEVFMQALENDTEYELVNPHDGIIAGTRRAREIMDKIVDAAWATGDPGLLFLDRANHSTANPIPEIERLEATNPCGEQWLGPYDACNLGSINVGLFVTRDERGKATEVDWAALEETTRLCVRFLDDVIDINPYPLEEVRAKVTANRRIGLGIMGWAELLFELGLRYDSDEAIALGERLMTSIRDWARAASEDIAAEREAFPNWSRSIYQQDNPLRNSTRTTVAPTGSISILAECSSGIEPIFALAFQHRVKQPDGGYRVLDFVNPFFERALTASDVEEKDGVLEYVKEHGSLHGHAAEEHLALRPFVTAHEIAPDWHIRMQAAFQRGVDNSISKTVNLNHEATREDVLQAYMLAWDLGCLGITIFRDGSKGEQVLNVGVKEEKKAEEATITRAAPATAHLYSSGIKDRPEVVHGYTRQVRAPEGKVNITLNSDEDGLLEIFVNVGKAGSDIAALAEAVGRLASLNLRLDSPLSQNERAREIARQLKSIGGSASVGFGIQRVRSLPDAVARSIDQHFAGELGEQGGVGQEASGNGAGGHANGGNGGGNGAPGLNPMMMAQYTVSGNLCSHCGNNTMIYEEGCKKCASCGHSEC